MSGTNALDSRGSVLSAIANPQVVNPLKAMTDATQAAGSVYDLRQKQANEAAGQAAQAAINKDTGEFDPNEYRRQLQARGGAAMAAQAGLANTQQISSDQLKQATVKLGMINSAAGALLDKDQPTYADAVGAMHSLLTSGGLTEPEFRREVGNIPTDPAGIKRWAQEHQTRSLAGLTQIEQQAGTVGTTTGPTGALTGYQQQPARKGGGVSAPQQTGVVQGLTAAQLAEQVEGPPDAQGNPTKETLADRLRRQNTIVPGMPEYKPPAATTSGLPPSLRNPANAKPAAPAAAPTTPAAPAPTPGGTPAVTGQSPAQTAAQTETGGTSAKEFADISKQAVAARSRGAVLDNMLSDTTQFTSGPLTSRIAAVRALANRFGIPVNTEGLSAQESFQKLAAQLNQNQGSDARLAISEASNPHADLSPAGLDLMIRQLRGNEDYLGARAALASKWGDKADSQKFENEVGSKLDPRAFQWARMKGDQKVKYLATLSDADQKKLRGAYNFAHDNGLLGP